MIIEIFVLTFGYMKKKYSNKMTSIMTAFNHVIPHIVDACLQAVMDFMIKEKGCQVTIEELRSIQISTPILIPNPMKVQGLPQGGMIPVQPPSLNNFMAMSASYGKTNTKKDKVPHNGPTCTYKFIRGKNKGQVCGEPAVEGSEFCRSCIKKKASGGPGNAAPDTPTGRVSGPGLGPGPVNGSRNDQNNNSDASGELTVVPYKNQPGYFKTVQHGFIVKQIEGNRIVATAVEENNKLRPLTEAEKRIAYDIGIGIVENETPTVSMQMGSGPTVDANVEQHTSSAVIPSTTPPIPSTTSTIPVATPPIPSTTPTIPSTTPTIPSTTPTIPVIPNLHGAVPKMNPLTGQNITIPMIPKVQ